MLEVYGSKHSLKPKIWDVEAVGIGATRSELRRPCLAMSAVREAQSHRSVGVMFHMSYCRMPSEAGDPLYEEYGPSFWASWQDAVRDAGEMVSKILMLIS